MRGMSGDMSKVTATVVKALALSAILVCAGLAAPAAYAAEEAKADATKKPEPKLSKAVAKPMKAAQEALNAKNYPEVISKLKEVEAIPGKTPDDEYVMNEWMGVAYAHSNDFANASKYLELGLSSTFIPESEIPNRVRVLAQMNYQIKNYDKAIEFGERAVKGGFAEDNIYTIVGQSYYIKNDFKGTERFINDYVNVLQKAGQQPKEGMLQLLLNSCVKTDDAPCTTGALEQLVAFYPKAEYWQNLLYSMFEGQNDKGLLHVYRLAAEVDVLKRADDYTEYAQLAIEAGSPGEAVSILEKGTQKNVFTDARSQDKAKRLLDSAKKQADTDKASLDKVANDAAAAKTGQKDVGVGLAFLSYKEYDKAVQAISRGLSKPGVQNEAEAQLLLGIAALGAGKKDEAQKAFKAVKGDPRLEHIANLWSLHARQV
jgi:hypothetical protein